MLGLPSTTEFNRRIPKQKFYENLTVTTALKRLFIDQIKEIVWKHKIATSTMNLAAGVYVTEIEIFEIELHGPELDVSVLQQMDREIPYHIIYLLKYNNRYQAWTAYKEEAQAGTNAFKVDTYYHTAWLVEEDIPLRVDGLNLDQVYENYVRQIAGTELTAVPNESLKESVERSALRIALKKRITKLQLKIRQEKQLNKQVKLNSELKKLKKELENI